MEGADENFLRQSAISAKDQADRDNHPVTSLSRRHGAAKLSSETAVRHKKARKRLAQVGKGARVSMGSMIGVPSVQYDKIFVIFEGCGIFQKRSQ